MADIHDELAAPGIWVIGLGPGDLSQLTIGALERLLAVDLLFFRTMVHPTIEQLSARLRPAQAVRSFDERYERASDFDQLYADIVDALLDAATATTAPIAYAVPGHPLVGERSVALLLEQAPARGVEIRLVDGISFLEPLIDMLRLDPLAGAFQLFDGAALLEGSPTRTELWHGQSPRLIVTGRPLVLGQVYDRRVASACKLWLLERYPAEHQLQIVQAAGTPAARTRPVALGELDHSAAFDHLTSIYVPPLDPLHDMQGLPTLPYIVARLREPDGCPWDRKQTLDSLKPHLIEEAYEAVAALDEADPEAIAEELGDVLLLVTMLAQIAEEEGTFDLPMILAAVTGKLIRRHPHVFGAETVDSADAVAQTWERLKKQDRRDDASALSGVPEKMPALITAQVMQRKAAGLGFDWDSVDGVIAKVEEELGEVRRAAADERLEEVGDLLFTLVSLCRHYHLDAEEALRKGNAKFRRRFEQLEALSRARGLELHDLGPAALDVLWESVKADEKAVSERL